MQETTALLSTRLLDRLLPPLARRRRTRPEDLLYAVDERPPVAVTVGMGLQHALLALVFTLYAVLVGEGIRLGPEALARYISATIFLLGLATLLQCVRSRIGSGMLLVALPAPSHVTVHIAVVLQYGLGAAIGAGIVSGLAILVFARFLPRLRAVFPPEVIGVVVLMLGLSLVAGGVSRSTGLGTPGGPSLAALATAGATLAVMVAVSIWGSPRLRAGTMLFGAGAGIAVTVLTGSFDPSRLQTVSELQLLAIPLLGQPFPMPEFKAVPILVIGLAHLMVVMDQVAAALTADRMNDAEWRRADMPMVARAVTGLGLMHVLSSVCGVLPQATSSANVGLAHATGITARRVGIAAGLVLCAAAFVPPLAALLAAIPAPVIGGILIYTAAYMIVAGMDLVMSRLINSRRSMTVGLAVVFGTAVMLLPDLADTGPAWAAVIIGSGLTVGSIAAVVLNGVLRIGIRRSVETELSPATEGREASAFLDSNGRLWGARRDVVARADLAIGEALEALRRLDISGPVTLDLRFDEFLLECTLRYEGIALPLEPNQRPDVSRALDGDDEVFEAAVRYVSTVMITQLSDRVRSVQRGTRADLRLSFDH